MSPLPCTRAHLGADRVHHVDAQHQRQAVEHHVGRHLLQAQRIAQQAQHHHQLGEGGHHHRDEGRQREDDDRQQRGRWRELGEVHGRLGGTHAAAGSNFLPFGMQRVR